MTHSKTPWELGTHPANHKLNIIKPVMLGPRITVLPECEGGHVSIKNKADAERIVKCVNLHDELVEAYQEFFNIAAESKINCGPKLRAKIQAAQEKFSGLSDKARGKS